MATTELFPLTSERAKPKELKLILARYLRYWYLFLISILLAIGAVFIYLRYYAVAKYEVISTLLVNDQTKNPVLPSVAATGIALEGTSKNLNNEIEVLKSTSLMQRVVNELALSASYYIKGRIKDVEVYGRSSPITVVISELDSTAFDKAIVIHLENNNKFSLREGDENPTLHQLGQLISKPYGKFTVVGDPGLAINDKLFDKDIVVQFHDIRGVASAISEAIEIAPINKESSVIAVSLVDPVPARGKDVINTLIKLYNKEELEYKNRNATNTINFLDERLKYITSELSTIERDVQQFKQQNEVADVSSQASNYIEQASSYNKQLSDWAIQIDVLESIEKYLNKTGDQYSMVPSTLGIQDATLVGLIERFNTLQLERERMLRSTEASNPLIQNINEQLSNLRTNILENLQNIKKGLIITSRNLKNSSGQFRSQIKQVPVIERELIEINKEKAIKQALYSFLLQKREETALELASNVSNSRIIDPAKSSDLPVSPHAQVVYLVGLLLGLSIPFAFVYIKDVLNDKVQDLQDIASQTNTPVLGELALHTTRESLVVTQDNHTELAEMFRLLRANFGFATRNNDTKVVLVTSSMSGEGKTFFSLNFSASLLLTNKRVVLLELDLRNSDLSYILGLQGGLGITDYLTSDTVLINDIIRESDKVEGLCVITSGPVPANPSELMMSSKLKYLIAQLKENFDYIILDTAPVGKVSDVFSLASLADLSIYLVRYNYTYKKMIKIIDDIYVSQKLNNPMIVVNGIKKENSNSYGYGYGKSKKSKSARIV